MKIISFNRRYTEQVGGDMSTDYGYKDAFGALGHIYEISNDYEKDLSDYDYIFLWHINWPWSIEVARNAKKYNKPLIVFSIFYDFRDYSQVGNVINLATIVFTFSEEEQEQIIRLCDLSDSERSKLYVLPTAINPMFMRTGVFMAGRYEDFKGQIKAIIACKKLGIPITLAGSKPDHNYYERCKMQNYGTLLGPKSGVEVQRILANTRVYIHPSQSERGCLAAHEAKAMGCKLVLTKNNGANKFLKPDALIDPNDQDDISTKLQQVYEDYPKTYFEVSKLILDKINGA